MQGILLHGRLREISGMSLHKEELVGMIEPSGKTRSQTCIVFWIPCSPQDAEQAVQSNSLLH